MVIRTRLTEASVAAESGVLCWKVINAWLLRRRNGSEWRGGSLGGVANCSPLTLTQRPKPNYICITHSPSNEGLLFGKPPQPWWIVLPVSLLILLPASLLNLLPVSLLENKSTGFRYRLLIHHS